MTVSKSPQRNTFQRDNYIKRCETEGKEISQDYLDMFDAILQSENDKLSDPKFQVDNLEYDLRTTEWMLDKVRSDEGYAQNLYAAMCNNQFVKNDVWPILADKRWSCSWRYAGGIIADMRQQGDYIDWYCSGMATNGNDMGGPYENELRKGFVPESHVTDEIQQDLLKLGWIVAPEDSTA